MTSFHSTVLGSSSEFRHSRRRWLQAGGLGMLGLGMSDLARLRSSAALDAAQEKGRRRSCVFVFLFGGPSHIDLWDMKPDAPEIVRGEFRPIETSVPGIRICEHLPQFARVMDKVCLLRSTTHKMNVHGPACSEVFTGREYFGPPTTDQATREDWPSLSSMMMRYGTGDRGMPPSVVLPWYLQFTGQSRRIAGQTGARMGEQYNAFLLQGEVERADFEMEGLRLADDVPMNRIDRRRNLLGRIDRRGGGAGNQSTATFDGHTRSAFDLLSNRVGEVFDLRRESEAMRARYGATAAGQSLLLARRLVEAGVGLVTVNWQDETKTDGVNTCWDTHQNNFPKLQNLLCPIFDRAFPAFLQDLDERGLLETTLVVALGEFGRTPKMGQFSQSANTQKTGRDHWPHAFTTLLAGGGVRGGRVYGATTRDGGYVQDDPVTPSDLTATILHHLGVDFTREYDDEFQHLKRRLSEGRVVTELS